MLNDSDKKSVFSNSSTMVFFKGMESQIDLSRLINRDKNYLYWSRFITLFYLEKKYPHFLEMAKKCFDFSKESNFSVSSDFLYLLKMTQALNLRIIKKTQVKEMVTSEDSSMKIDWVSLFLPIFRANILSLMLLTGETHYYSEGFNKTPIIIDGEKSEILDSYQFKRTLNKK